MEIIEELISKRLIYKGQKIYYSSIQKANALDTNDEEPTFLDLYAPYKSLMAETTFAKIIGIGSSSLSEKRKSNSSQRMIVNVFKKNQLTDAEKLECVSFLKNKYSLGLSHNQRERGIYYSETQRDNAKDTNYSGPFFYTMYKDLPMNFKTKCSEQELASLLGIRGFLSFRGPNYKYKATLTIPVSEFSEDQRQKLLKYLIKKYSLYKGQKIYYSRKYSKTPNYSGPFIDEIFQNLPEDIKSRLKIEDIISLLDIRHFNQTRAMQIFSSFTLSEEEKKEYFDYLVDTYQLSKQYSKKGLFFSEAQKNNSADTNYSGPYLLDMYKNSPLEFKSKCTIYEMLELLQSTRNYKSSTQNARNNKIVILVNQELTSEENESINGLATRFERRSIQYKSNSPSFVSLYEKYRLKLTEKEFAEKLGISPYILKNMKLNPEYSAVIVSMDKVSKAKSVMSNISESRFYSLEELNSLCSNVGISLEDFISYSHAFGKKTSILYSILQRRKKLFITSYLEQSGKFTIRRKHIPMTPYTYNSIYPTLELKIKKSVFALIGKYQTTIEQEDLIQIGLEFVFSQCGDLERNFCEYGQFASSEEEDEFWSYIISLAKKYMRYEIFKEKKASRCFQKSRRHFSSSSLDDYFIDDDIFHFEDAELIDWENDDSETKAIKLRNIILHYIEDGNYNTSEIISAIQDRFGISSQKMSELLSILQAIMIDKGFAKSNTSGRIFLGNKEDIEI